MQHWFVYSKTVNIYCIVQINSFFCKPLFSCSVTTEDV